MRSSVWNLFKLGRLRMNWITISAYKGDNDQILVGNKSSFQNKGQKPLHPCIFWVQWLFTPCICTRKHTYTRSISWLFGQILISNDVRILLKCSMLNEQKWFLRMQIHLHGINKRVEKNTQLFKSLHPHYIIVYWCAPEIIVISVLWRTARLF